MVNLVCDYNSTKERLSIVKKCISLLLIIMLFISLLTGCSNNKENSLINETVATASNHQAKGEYVYANYDEYNSYAEDNGRGNTKVYTEGIFSYISIKDSDIFGTLKTDDGNWTIFFFTESNLDEIQKCFLSKKVIMYGTYQGFSDLTNQPCISFEKIESDGSTYFRYDFSDPIEETSSPLPSTVQDTIPETTENSIETLIYNVNNIKVSYAGIRIDDDGDQRISLLIENNTSKDWEFVLMNVTVNDFVMDPVFRIVIPSGKKAYEDMFFLHSLLEQSKIQNINEVSFQLHYFDTINPVKAKEKYTTDYITIKL